MHLMQRSTLLQWLLCGALGMGLTLLGLSLYRQAQSAPPTAATARPTSDTTSQASTGPTWRYRLASKAYGMPLRWLGTYPLNISTKRRFDASGLTGSVDGKSLVFVNDKGRGPALFGVPLPSLSPRPTSMPSKAEQALFAQALTPASATMHPPPAIKKNWKAPLVLDLEGITACQGAYLAVAEQYRQLIRYDLRTQRWTRHSIDIDDYAKRSLARARPVPAFSLSHNASYEGIACAPQQRRLYLVQERQPRMVFVAQLPTRWNQDTTLRLIDHFDLPGLGFPQRIGKYDVDPDFSGAAVDGRFLYLLYRNARAILKVDPHTHQLRGIVSYAHVAKDLYRYRKPFGLAEGLWLDQHSIWVVFDNNGRARMWSSKDRRPVLMRFRRPQGF